MKLIQLKVEKNLLRSTTQNFKKGLNKLYGWRLSLGIGAIRIH